METCTVTASDAITAFAVPNPNYSSQSRRFFQVWLLFGLPRRADHSAYFGLAKFYLSQPFQPSTEANLESCSKIVNARFQCNRPVALDQEPETQPVESLPLNNMGDQILSLFPQEHPQALRRRGRVLQIKDVCGNHVSILTPGNRSRMVVTGAFTQWQT